MTHEYVIAPGGIVPGAVEPTGATPTAVAWAADRVLAVGSGEAVRAISRGDSTFLDLAGCAVTPAPEWPAAAEDVVRAAVAAGRPFDAAELMAQAGLLAPDARVETGAGADLAFWSADPGAVPPSAAASLRIVAIVRAGAFTAGDEHAGPFARLPRPTSGRTEARGSPGQTDATRAGG